MGTDPITDHSAEEDNSNQRQDMAILENNQQAGVPMVQVAQGEYETDMPPPILRTMPMKRKQPLQRQASNEDVTSHTESEM